jgi:hypothetical protein
VKAQPTDSLCEEKNNELFASGAPLYRFKGRLVVPDDEDFRRAVLSEAHGSQFTVHPGRDKMYKDMKSKYYWVGMKKDITVFVSKCINCQLVKINHQRLPGTL